MVYCLWFFRPRAVVHHFSIVSIKAAEKHLEEMIEPAARSHLQHPAHLMHRRTLHSLECLCGHNAFSPRGEEALSLQTRLRRERSDDLKVAFDRSMSNRTPPHSLSFDWKRSRSTTSTGARGVSRRLRRRRPTHLVTSESHRQSGGFQAASVITRNSTKFAKDGAVRRKGGSPRMARR